MSVDRETSRVMKGVQHGACEFVSSNKRALLVHILSEAKAAQPTLSLNHQSWWLTKQLILII
ncbi:hypothetical protein GIB67_006954 [Kingdonia uniflora]|uniref:Uncharacterized protein n=1 Tax=Kingdonia uniflora TaxID=39325 RepID=A0A7J7NZ24_9MAGN|nr:hypothetical protein GIB67_006954 [Kingdonia uniflora]